MAESEERLVKREVLQIVSRKAYFSHEIRKKLKLKGFSEEAIEGALEWGMKGGFIDDSQKTQHLIGKEQRKGYGAQSILFKLRQNKISSAELKNLRPEILAEEKESLQQLFKKRYSKLDWKDPKVKRKILAQLQRRGFSFESIQSVIPIGINLDSRYTQDD